MMPTDQQPVDIAKTISQIKEVITKNDSGIIVLPSKATPDAIAAGTSMYMALTKMGKNVSLVSSSIPESDFTGVDKIKTDLVTGGENLVVSFPYEDGAIDKVDYNIKNERFNLIIIPREGHEKLEPKDVQFTYTGGKIDFIITIDTPNLNAIGELYQKNQRDFEGQTIINIDRHLINNSYGMINLVVKTSSSTSELVLQVIKGIKVEIDRDIATNLYSGVLAATNNFTAYSVNADTFEAVAELLRSGAVKKPISQNQFARPQGMPTGGNTPFGVGPQFGGQNVAPQMSPRASFPQMNPFQNFPQRQVSQQQPQGQPQQIQPQQNSSKQTDEKQTRQIGQVEMENRPKDGNDNVANESENELKPKIFAESDGLI